VLHRALTQWIEPLDELLNWHLTQRPPLGVRRSLLP
jgi:hypothetical protein